MLRKLWKIVLAQWNIKIICWVHENKANLELTIAVVILEEVPVRRPQAKGKQGKKEKLAKYIE